MWGWGEGGTCPHAGHDLLLGLALHLHHSHPHLQRPRSFPVLSPILFSVTTAREQSEKGTAWAVMVPSLKGIRFDVSPNSHNFLTTS